MNDPAVACVVVGHYDERTSHPRYRQYPAVFAPKADEAWNLETGSDLMVFDTNFIRNPERDENRYPGP